MNQHLWLSWVTFALICLASAGKDCSCYENKMSECVAIVEDASQCADDENFWQHGPCGGINFANSGSGYRHPKVATVDCCKQRCCELQTEESSPDYIDECVDIPTTTPGQTKSEEMPDENIVKVQGTEDEKILDKSIVSKGQDTEDTPTTTTQGQLQSKEVVNEHVESRDKGTEDAPTTTSQGQPKSEEVVNGHLDSKDQGTEDMPTTTTQGQPKKNEETLANNIVAPTTIQGKEDMEDAEAKKKRLAADLKNTGKMTCRISNERFKTFSSFGQGKGVHAISSWATFKQFQKEKDRGLQLIKKDIERAKETIEDLTPLVKEWESTEIKCVDDLIDDLFKPWVSEVSKSDNALKEACRSEEAESNGWTDMIASFGDRTREYFISTSDPPKYVKAEDYELVDACVRTILDLSKEQAQEITENPEGDVTCYNKCDELKTVVPDDVFSWNDGTKDRQELNDASVRYDNLQEEKKECEDAWKTIELFQEELRKLKEAFDAASKLSGDAERSKDDAQAILGAATENQTQAEAVQDAAIASLKDAEIDTSDAEAAANTSKIALEEARQLAETALQKLEGASSDLEAANEAFKQVMAVRGLVAEIMSAMRTHYEQAVLWPMQNIGFQKTKDMDSQESKAEEKTARDTIETTFKEMSDACAESDKAARLSERNLTFLCDFQSLEDATAEVVETIEAKRKETQVVVDKLFGWAEPYWNHYKWEQGPSDECVDEMTEECEAWLDEKGEEPAGLRKVLGIFSSTEFYEEYWTHWRFDDENSFLKLSTEFQASLARANQSAESFKTEAASFDLALQAAHEAAQDAQEKLQQALASQNMNSAKLADAKKALEEAQQEHARQMDIYNKLQDEFKEAKSKFREAAELYLNTAKGGISGSLLQMLAEFASARRAKVKHDSTRSASRTRAVGRHMA